jgi:acid phosphatase
MCASAQAQEAVSSFLDATLWVQTSVEYRAVAKQAYRAAGANLVRAIRDPQWTAALEQEGAPLAELPPAVVLDLDETVLDNSAYQAQIAAAGTTFSDDTWQAWVSQARAGAVPGAVEFLKTAAALGVEAVFITNRVCDAGNLLDPTVQVLRTHGISFQPSNLMCKQGASDKSARRKAAAARYRLVMLFGDDFRDFVSLPKEADTLDGRMEAAQSRDYWLGERWFILPNPMYGSWESALSRSGRPKTEFLRK